MPTLTLMVPRHRLQRRPYPNQSMCSVCLGWYTNPSHIPRWKWWEREDEVALRKYVETAWRH